MTRQQFRRMRDFALRMTGVAIGGARWQRVVRGHVQEILDRLGDPDECFECSYRHIASWDNLAAGSELSDSMCLCDFVSEYLWENRLKREIERRDGLEVVESKCAIAVSCCIRAACDVAVAPSAGVLGFTVGDLRRMWRPHPLPAWLLRYFAEPRQVAAAPDHHRVWL